ncbi:MAG TPA: Ig-like domain-containing protein, partial [Flavobacterium sp.]|nr:Ig-like domain-containing protein [Flavobacterium sp.]
MPKFRLRFLFFILALAAAGCAKRGNITGGLKDTIPPVLRSSSPPNFSTNFNEREIKITFSEYIKIKDVNKQLIVSPPMENAPIVSPTNASRYISIKIKDTLKPNTTYSFNFGSSIQDNNEGNPFQQF